MTKQIENFLWLKNFKNLPAEFICPVPSTGQLYNIKGWNFEKIWIQKTLSRESWQGFTNRKSKAALLEN